MLEITNLYKSYDSDSILNGIDFSINKGEVVAILGPSGSGKTTFLRCLSFLTDSDQGHIILDNIDTDMPTAKSKVIHDLRLRMGFVFQEFNLFRNKTVLENVTEGLIIARKYKKDKANEIARDVLLKVGMLDKESFYPDELSGGQKQRVAIARALAPNPDIILFDEPTSALDPELTQEVLDVITKLAKEGTTMIIVTHEIEFAKNVSSRIIFVEKGKIVEDNDTASFFTNPREERSREFIGKYIKDI